MLQLISEFSEVIFYKMNIQKSITFLYTDNEKNELKLKMQY